MTTPTLAPGVNPSFPFDPSGDWPHDTQDSIKGYARTIPQTLRKIRRLGLVWQGLTRDQRDYFESFFDRLRGPGGIFWWTPPDPVPSPNDAGPDVAQVTRTGAPAGQRTYSVRFSWFSTTTGLETKASPAVTLAVLGGKVLQVTPPLRPAGVDAFRVYAGVGAGNEVLQGASSALTWEEPITGLVAGTAPVPAANACRVPILWSLVSPVRPTKASANRWDLALDFEEKFC